MSWWQREVTIPPILRCCSDGNGDFADAGVDYVTLETGLGGRLDATTAVENPVACVITSISLDHMQYLGNTVKEIAGGKAGIIVPDVPVIYDGNDPDAAQVIGEKAKELGSPAYKVVQSEMQRFLEMIRMELIFLKMIIMGIPASIFHFIASYQVMNASLALMTMEVLREQIPVTKWIRWQGNCQKPDGRWEGWNSPSRSNRGWCS